MAVPPRSRPLIPATALALALALAVLLAHSTLRAHPCASPTDFHRDASSRTCRSQEHLSPGRLTYVNPGQDHELVLDLVPPPSEETQPGEHYNRYLEAGDHIRITLPGYDLSRLTTQEQIADGSLITIASTNPADPRTETPQSARADQPTQSLLLTVGANLESAFPPGSHLVITLKEGTNLLAPDTPSGFDDKSDPYPVTVTFIDTGTGLPEIETGQVHSVATRNPVSSTVPGEEVRLTLHTHARTPIRGNEDVVVDFTGPSPDASFTVPETIDERNVTVEWPGQSPTQAAGVLVQGTKVIITIPVIGDEPTRISGNYTITFKERAKVRNPKAAGTRIISLYPAAHPDTVDEIIAVIRRTTTADPPRGPRGTHFTLEGKGYADGTVTVFSGDDDTIDAGEMLGFANTQNAAFTLELTARGDPGTPVYRVWTLDGNGVYHSVDFPIESAMSFDPERVRSGQELQVTITDWEQEHPALAAVTIGGRTAYAATAVGYQNCFDLVPDGLHSSDRNGTISLRVTVPVSLPPGRQNVAAYGPAHVRMPQPGEEDSPVLSKPHCSALPEGTDPGEPTDDPARPVRVSVSHDPVASMPVELIGRGLRTVPRTAARGERITIIGSDTARISDSGRDLQEISIAGSQVTEDPGSFHLPPSGEFALAVTVPLDAPGGTNEVRVVGRDGTISHGTVIVASPALQVAPGGGRRGAPITITGTGFVAHGLISVYYGDGGDLSTGDRLLEVLLADRKGAFTQESAVPYEAELGVRHIVTATARMPAGSLTGPVRASAQHTVAPARVAAGTDTVCPGDTLTVTGDNLPPFAAVSQITLGGLPLLPATQTTTDKEGAFTAEVTVPASEPGNQTLLVMVADTAYVDVVEVVDPPLTGHPARVFKSLIRAGVLTRVWRLDNRTQIWSFFDPDPQFVDFNSLDDVSAGDIVSLHITANHRFRDLQLYPGWNAIEMK